MPSKPLREADLRSLERKSMYSIFSPLDPNERLPREMIEKNRRHREVGRRELVGLMWLPAIFALLVIFGWTGANGLVALVASIVVLGGLFLFAFSGGR
jgi:hypothetical protein